MNDRIQATRDKMDEYRNIDLTVGITLNLISCDSTVNITD